MNKNNWLNPQIIQNVKDVFEPRYKRPLSDQEAVSIALNLTTTIEELIKLKWKEKYGKNV